MTVKTIYYINENNEIIYDMYSLCKEQIKEFSNNPEIDTNRQIKYPKGTKIDINTAVTYNGRTFAKIKDEDFYIVIYRLNTTKDAYAIEIVDIPIKMLGRLLYSFIVFIICLWYISRIYCVTFIILLIIGYKTGILIKFINWGISKFLGVTNGHFIDIGF